MIVDEVRVSDQRDVVPGNFPAGRFHVGRSAGRGVQIVGTFRDDAALLSFARAIERALPSGKVRPTLPESSPTATESAAPPQVRTLLR